MMHRGDIPSISRRDFLRLLMLGGAGWLVSCSKTIPPLTSSTPATSTASKSISTPTLVIPKTNTPPPTTASQPAPTSPINIRQKIDTVIILLQENHSFDSLFGKYPGVDGKPAPNICPDTIQHAIPEGGTTIAYYCSYTGVQVPLYWTLAQRFTLCDNYFSEVRLPSFPNYLMLTSADAPITANPRAPYKCPNYCQAITSIASRLDNKGVTWHDYGGMFAGIQSLQGRPEISYRDLDGFFRDAADGNLSNVSWIGTYLVGGTKASGHPPGNICDAQDFALKIIEASMSGPQWLTTLIILTWDEFGNFYEHTIPPIVEKLPNGKPFRYGFRVPCLVISPYSRAGFVSHTEYSHVSTLRTIETIFDLPAINDRDGAANSLLDCLDLTQAPIAPLSLSASPCSP